MAQIFGGGSYVNAWSTPKKKTTYQPIGGGGYRSGYTTGGGVTPYQSTPKITGGEVGGGGVSGGGVTTTGGGGGGFDFSKLMGQYQPTDWQSPQLPQEPQVTQQMILDWQARAKTEAGMQFDPQLLAMQQEFEKMMLGAEQSKGAIDPAYQEIIDYVKNWQEEETGATQRRHYARGLGQGGGLVEEEGKIAERGLKEVTAAGTERARKLGDIEEQKLLMMEQSGAKREEIEVQKGRYVAARSSDLEESYRANKQQLEQQRFANQMQVAQVGMTAETQNFQNWLGTMSLANETWYREQTLGLERESMALSERARAEAAAYSGQSGLTPYQIQQQENWEKTFAEGTRQFDEGNISMKELQEMIDNAWKGTNY